jgi:hypothetical protein
LDAIDLDLEPVQRLNRDLAKAGALLGPREARHLVDTYYDFQAIRIIAENRLRAVRQASDDNAADTLDFLTVQAEVLEKQMAKAITRWAEVQPEAEWAMAQKGIGPILSGGLSAHIDIEKCPTVSHIFRFAGLDPHIKWLGKEKALALIPYIYDEDFNGDLPGQMTEMEEKKLADIMGDIPEDFGLSVPQLLAVAKLTNRSFRSIIRGAGPRTKEGPTGGPVTKASLQAYLARIPWNKSLKMLCWKIGESFVKVSGSQDAYYGALYAERKMMEVERNEEGELAPAAARALEDKKWNKGTDAYKAYAQGKLPPAHIHARAKRYAVKRFLSDWHTVTWELRTGRPVPQPWVIEFGGHHDYAPPPGYTPLKGGRMT